MLSVCKIKSFIRLILILVLLYTLFFLRTEKFRVYAASTTCENANPEWTSGCGTMDAVGKGGNTESHQCDYPGGGVSPHPGGSCPAGTFCTVPTETGGAPCCVPCDYATNTDTESCNEDWEECCVYQEHLQTIKTCHGFIEGPYGITINLECRDIGGVSRCRPEGCGVSDTNGEEGGINANAVCCQGSYPCDDGGLCQSLYPGDPGHCYGDFAPDTHYPQNWQPITPYKGPIISSISALLAPMFKILYYVGIFVGILGIIYSGYLFISSEGDPGRVKEGKEQFTAAILGSLFVLLSVFILRVIINNILGIESSGL